MTRRTMVGVAGATLLAPISPIVGKSLAEIKKGLDIAELKESGSINVTAYKYLMFVDPSVIHPEVFDKAFPGDWPEILVIFTHPHAPAGDPIRLYKL